MVDRCECLQGAMPEHCHDLCRHAWSQMQTLPDNAGATANACQMLLTTHYVHSRLAAARCQPGRAHHGAAHTRGRRSARRRCATRAHVWVRAERRCHAGQAGIIARGRVRVDGRVDGRMDVHAKGFAKAFTWTR